MIVEPKVRGFMCTTAHPEGCKAAVREQIDYINSMPKTDGPKKVLVIGASMGYGLASRIALTYSCDADTIGVIFDKAGKEKRTGTAGWYNTVAFEEFATKDGHYAKTINGDAFSDDIKKETIDLIKKDFGKVDMVIYSVAAPRRKAPDGEINATVKVMGGEDWRLWIDAMKEADVLSDNAVTVAYSYIGPVLTHPIYFDGSIGKAKADLYKTADEIDEQVDGVSAYVSVNKAVVTQSSAAIPIVPLYLSILLKVMKEKNVHEECIQQMYRLVHDRLCNPSGVPVDDKRLIRMDDYEMESEVQQEVEKIWNGITPENLTEVADIDEYWKEFYEIFGFKIDGVDYGMDCDIQVQIPSLDSAE